MTAFVRHLDFSRTRSKRHRALGRSRK